MRPALSIVIPSHKRPDLLRPCLASVLRFAPRGTQVLVVDDGSPDRVVSHAAESFGVEVLRLDSRSGYCVAANLGVAAAGADIVELLNDDTEVTPGWADVAIAPFRDLKVAAVTPIVMQAGRQEIVDSTGDEYHAFGIARKRGHGERLNASHLVAGPVFGASGSASFFRREAFLAVGGLPVEFGAYFDDVDLSFRLRRAGYEIWYEPASRVHHHVSSSHGPPRGDLLAMQSRNEELVFWRNLSGWKLALALPGHAAVVAGKAMLRLREGHLRPWLSGRLAAWRGVPGVLRQRLHLLRTQSGTSIPREPFEGDEHGCSRSLV